MGGRSIEIGFESQQEDVWNSIIGGLFRGETGALFQDRMDVFGEAVADRLEIMLERWPSHYFHLQGFQISNHRFWLEFLIASVDADEFALAIIELFEKCGIEKLTCSVIDASSN